jgi:hypothetical protein
MVGVNCTAAATVIIPQDTQLKRVIKTTAKPVESP